MKVEGRLTLVAGGVRSGKSVFAEQVIENSGSQFLYLATCRSYDEGMQKRICIHKERRGPEWTTVEVGSNLLSGLDDLPAADAVLLDCLPLWLSEKMFSNCASDSENLKGELAAILRNLRCRYQHVVVVTAEVGMGVIPVTKLGRDFQDKLGELNQLVAKVASEVYQVVMGLPQKLK
tara:strand:- start:1736 stop:2266 length:531 start_codon:yes stop_codon:yes gene_type:complete